MKALKLAIIVAMATAIVVFLVYERRREAKLRSRIDYLQKQVQQLTTENRNLMAQHAKQDMSRPQTAKEASELLRLRGEVGLLRQELREMKNRRAEAPQVGIQAAASTPPRAGPFGTELRDMGATTPERAATSLIWAASTGTQARFAELLELPGSVPEQDTPKHYEFFAKQLSNVFARMEFTSIESVKPNPDGTLRLNQMYRDVASGKIHPFPFMLRLHDSGWKVVVEGDVPK